MEFHLKIWEFNLKCLFSSMSGSTVVVQSTQDYAQFSDLGDLSYYCHLNAMLQCIPLLSKAHVELQMPFTHPLEESFNCFTVI